MGRGFDPVEAAKAADERDREMQRENAVHVIDMDERVRHLPTRRYWSERSGRYVTREEFEADALADERDAQRRARVERIIGHLEHHSDAVDALDVLLDFEALPADRKRAAAAFLTALGL